jgi:hypothetical protein
MSDCFVLKIIFSTVLTTKFAELIKKKTYNELNKNI